MKKIGVPSLSLALCLLGAWVCVFLIISRGVKSSGKCSYFLALFPYVIMIALLIRAVTLEGATKGIIFFLTPQWHELINPKVIYPPPRKVVTKISGSIAFFFMKSNYL